MQKNVQINEDKFIQDLETGFVLVNFDRKETTENDKKIIVAGEQYRLKSPATYSSIVNTVVKENYKNGDDEAAIRKGIIDKNNPEFVAFNEFVKMIKLKCKNEGIC